MQTERRQRPLGDLFFPFQQNFFIRTDTFGAAVVAAVAKEGLPFAFGFRVGFGAAPAGSPAEQVVLAAFCAVKFAVALPAFGVNRSSADAEFGFFFRLSGFSRRLFCLDRGGFLRWLRFVFRPGRKRKKKEKQKKQKQVFRFHKYTPTTAHRPI